MNMKKILSFPKTILIGVACLALSWAPANLGDENKPTTNDNTIKEEVAANSLNILENQAMTAYQAIGLEQLGLPFDVFEKAYIGFLNLKDSQKISEESSVLSIADFSQSSKKKRLWIVDLKDSSLLLNTWVSHGRGSGGDIPTKFSNINNSHQSSLGFYVTGEVYYGKHGRSLRLDGMDPGFNSKARERAIVLHGADYVSQSFIRRAGRLGRSFGCPAVPVSLCDGIIDQIKEKTVLFIHGPGDRYHSPYLDTAASSAVAAVYSRPEMNSSAVGSQLEAAHSRPEADVLAEFIPRSTSSSSP